jgi:hypothetical protein
MPDRYDRHDRDDDINAWLSERIEPLSPPPGTFDLIKRRARRRKFRKLAITGRAVDQRLAYHTGNRRVLDRGDLGAAGPGGGSGAS